MTGNEYRSAMADVAWLAGCAVRRAQRSYQVSASSPAALSIRHQPYQSPFQKDCWADATARRRSKAAV